MGCWGWGGCSDDDGGCGGCGDDGGCVDSDDGIVGGYDVMEMTKTNDIVTSKLSYLQQA